jgi:dihydropteroate synthase
MTIIIDRNHNKNPSNYNNTKMVAIVNLTPDSFSDGGSYNNLANAVKRVNRLLGEGAKIIDIGAESTRPNAVKISSEEEWQRLKDILPELINIVKKYNQHHNFSDDDKVLVSLDSYHFDNLQQGFNLGIDIFNDVGGLEDKRIIDFIANHNIKTILMHNQKIDPNPDLIINPHFDITKKIIDWANNKINYLESCKVKKSQLIFDPGIGFNKDAFQSIKILKEIAEYKAIGLPIYVGHSRKSFLDMINIDIADNNDDEEENDDNNQSDNQDKIKNINIEKLKQREYKTFLISKFLARQGVDYIRVHNVKDNLNFIHLD